MPSFLYDPPRVPGGKGREVGRQKGGIKGTLMKILLGGSQIALGMIGDGTPIGRVLMEQAKLSSDGITEPLRILKIGWMGSVLSCYPFGQ
jgi:hypothetical protein